MTAADIDYLIPGYDLGTGGISPAEVLGRGRNTDLIEDATVALAEARVRKSGVLEKLDQWAAEDRNTDGTGGRPAMISSRAVLTAFLLLARESSPMHVRRAALLLQVRLTPASQKLLGLPESDSELVLPSASKDRWYNNTMRAFQRMNSRMDPYPQERYTAKTHEMIQAILDAHDPVRSERYKARLNEFTRLFLRMTIMEQPRAIRRRYKKLDLSFDQTYVGTPTTRGFSHNTIKNKIAVERSTADFGKIAPGPVDAFAGWHVGNGERTDYQRHEVDQTNPKDKKNSGKVFDWGWVANLAVRVDSEAPGTKRFPTLVVAASLSIPNREVAEEAVDLLRSATTLGMEPGVADADKQYWANSVPGRLLKPALETGFTPSTEYRVDRLGVRGGQHGALAVEGDMYCPSTPAPLLNATKDAHDGVIDIATYKARIKSRKAFALHVKDKAKSSSANALLRCPALGPSPSVTCPLREMMKSATRKARPHVEPETLEEEFLDTICKKHSASFDLTAMQQPAQAFDYGTDEWEEFHEHARNTVESENQQLKASGDEDIETAGRRRVRGISAAQIIITLLLVNHNIRKIASFLDDEQRRDRKNSPAEPSPTRRRDRAWLNKYTKTNGDGDIRVRNTKDLKRSTEPQPLRT
ncbi:hypothetical protein [Microbacterium luteum]|uniref:hypothetical protein n=1 Tax=Microbacterium luteum TaxID=2782167 RepID=UPI001886D0A8|nr:hypothetical protein [Microbacterium luteum]